uniref:Uncharacterized protein n=1 Tax=Avena sativa TaxID=4498 RepID=A0ACD5ZDQ2_AVESA
MLPKMAAGLPACSPTFLHLLPTSTRRRLRGHAATGVQPGAISNATDDGPRAHGSLARSLAPSLLPSSLVPSSLRRGVPKTSDDGLLVCKSAPFPSPRARETMLLSRTKAVNSASDRDEVSTTLAAPTSERTHATPTSTTSANILLDDNFHAKISDFGISRLVNTNATVFTERVTGSIGYMDPLFYRDGSLTSKSDVYSFGIVLLELITRKKASVRKGEIGIVQCFTQALATGIRRVKELFDVEISSQNNMKVLEGAAKLAGECLRMEIDRRPEMTDVVERNFDKSHLVVVGGHGNVYYGVIDGAGGPTKVAIKRCTDVTFVQNVNKFQEEIIVMAKLRHRRLVSLVGFCNENNEIILIYGYVASGTLRERLHGYKEESPLTWIQRLCVCIGVARALHYRRECSSINSYLTTRDIFLDERLVAKVSLPHVPSLQQYTEITGSYHHTEIYIDTELPEISDVYSFGVVLLEVLCARAVQDLTLPRNLVHFANSALDCKKKGILDRIVDPNLKGKIDPWCFNKFVETAEKCVAFNSVDRPLMEEVVQNLEMCLAEESEDHGDKK